MTKRLTVQQMVDKAWPLHRAKAMSADRIFRSYCEADMPRVPGIDTVLRLAIRIDNGHTVREAAAREYVYRWHLAMLGRVWTIPHTIGM